MVFVRFLGAKKTNLGAVAPGAPPQPGKFQVLISLDFRGGGFQLIHRAT